MNLSTAEYFLVSYLGPALLFVIWAWVRVYRKRKAGAVAEAQSAGAAAGPVERPFEPTPEKPPDVLLRRFALPQRTYLRQQYPFAWLGLIFCGYLLLIASCSGLLPESISASAGNSPAQKLMNSYLQGLGSASYMAATISFFTALLAVSSLQTATAIFGRTRPLTFAFLFRARVWSALAVLLAAVTTAVLLSNLLLLLVAESHGGLGSISGHALLGGDMALPLAAGAGFSAVAAMGSLPFGRRANGTGRLPVIIPMLAGGLIGGQVVPLVRWLRGTQVERLFIFAGDSSVARAVGIPVAWLLAVMLMLLLAERLSARIEL